MSQQPSSYIKQWLNKAQNDLDSAQTLLNREPPLTDTASFHCQQAVEKYLKAFLIFNEEDIGKVHDLEYLQEKTLQFDEEFESFDVKDLTFYGVTIRYPDDYYIPNQKEAEQYLEIA